MATDRTATLAALRARLACIQGGGRTAADAVPVARPVNAALPGGKGLPRGASATADGPATPDARKLPAAAEGFGHGGHHGWFRPSGTGRLASARGSACSLLHCCAARYFDCVSSRFAFGLAC